MQSKISNIFAGVPIPKKKKPLSESPDFQENDELSKAKQLSQDEIVIEESIEVIEQTDLQSQAEEKQINEIEAELSGMQNIEDGSSDEQFTAVEEPEYEIKAPERSDGIEEIKHSEKIISEESQKRQEKSSFDHLLSPHVSSQKPEEPISKEKKISADAKIQASPVKEPIVEKPVSSKKKIEIADVPGTFDKQRVSRSKIPKVESAKKRDLRSSRKISSKPASNRLKSKSDPKQAKQKTMAILAIALTIVLIFVLGKQFNLFSLGSGDTEIIQQPGPVTINTGNSKQIQINWTQPSAYPDNLRDPMELPDDNVQNNIVTPANLTPDFVVGGIQKMNGEFLVLIGTQYFKKNDKINNFDAIITDITDNVVTFKNSEGRIWTQAVGDKTKNWKDNVLGE